MQTQEPNQGRDLLGDTPRDSFISRDLRRGAIKGVYEAAGEMAATEDDPKSQIGIAQTANDLIGEIMALDLSRHKHLEQGR